MENLGLKPKVELVILVRDKNGNVLKEFKKENDPLTRWALRFLYAKISGSNHTVKAEDGAMRTFRWDYGGNKWAYKIAIGLDPTAVSFEDFKLYAKERETTSLTVTSYAESDSSGQFDIKYDFLIETDKTFYEFGLFGYAWDGGTYYSFCVSRDVVTAGVSVPANSYLTVIYRVMLGTV